MTKPLRKTTLPEVKTGLAVRSPADLVHKPCRCKRLTGGAHDPERRASIQRHVTAEVA
ncbi:MAG: hypothetical protein ACN4GZ_19955 [Acidimicrobiales bacterium]